jgi:hypothetical protein
MSLLNGAQKTLAASGAANERIIVADLMMEQEPLNAEGFNSRAESPNVRTYPDPNKAIAFSAKYPENVSFANLTSGPKGNTVRDWANGLLGSTIPLDKAGGVVNKWWTDLRNTAREDVAVMQDAMGLTLTSKLAPSQMKRVLAFFNLISFRAKALLLKGVMAALEAKGVAGMAELLASAPVQENFWNTTEWISATGAGGRFNSDKAYTPAQRATEGFWQALGEIFTIQAYRSERALYKKCRECGDASRKLDPHGYRGRTNEYSSESSGSEDDS